MKNIFLVLVGLTLFSAPLYAVGNGDFGLGVIVGDPFGPTAKYWFNDSRALDIGMGFPSDFKLYGDYLWTSWDIFPQPAQGRLATSLGLGPRLVFLHDDTQLGLRTVAGLYYWVARNPLEIFLEIAPVFVVSPETSTDIDAGIGIRYYFNMLPVPRHSSSTSSHKKSKYK